MFLAELAKMGVDIRKLKDEPRPQVDGDIIQKHIKSEYTITKRNDEKKQVFGWALVSAQWETDTAGKPVLKKLVDYQKDIVDEDEMEKIAYQFVLKYRNGGDMHIDEEAGTATCIESICMTVEKQQAMGIPEGVVPVGWWIGFQINDDDLWDKVKKGDRKAFSIEGTAVRQKVEIEDPENYNVAGA
jgi:hypothetical protein